MQYDFIIHEANHSGNSLGANSLGRSLFWLWGIPSIGLFILSLVHGYL